MRRAARCHRDAIAALRLCFIERRVGLCEYSVGRFRVFRENRQSDRSGEVGQQLSFVQDIHARHHVHQRLGATHGHGQIHLRHYQHELLAALPAGDVLAARIALQHARERDQHRVACRVSVTVVEVLEAIQVKGQYRQRQSATLAARQLTAQRLAQVASIEQSGQGIAH